SSLSIAKASASGPPVIQRIALRRIDASIEGLPARNLSTPSRSPRSTKSHSLSPNSSISSSRFRKKTARSTIAAIDITESPMSSHMPQPLPRAASFERTLTISTATSLSLSSGSTERVLGDEQPARRVARGVQLKEAAAARERLHEMAIFSEGPLGLEHAHGEG